MQTRIIISGQVQGVGFRYFIQDQACKLGITGWTRNLPAGRHGAPEGHVEALFQGEETKVFEIIELCKKGPESGQVEKVEEFPANEPKLQDFVVK